MRKYWLAATGLLLTFQVGFAQGEGEHRGQRRDPKEMTAKVSEKLGFTAEQKAKLTALNDKYKGENYDRMKYREEFQQILTDTQRQQMEEMRKKRMSRQAAE